MKQENSKNIVVLKDLPSNIVEEAIIVLKTKKLAKKAQKIEKSKGTKSKEPKKIQSEYIIKEAEMLVSSFVSRIEENKTETKEKNKETKYKRARKYAYITTVILLIESIILFIK